MTKNWHWIDSDALFVAHDEAVDKFGGGHGVRDKGLIISALHRPQQLAYYNEDADMAELAAAYLHGIMKNHGFMDGNKRSGYLAAKGFLLLNGCTLNATATETFNMLLEIANNEKSQDDLAVWFRTKIIER